MANLPGDSPNLLSRVPLHGPLNAVSAWTPTWVRRVSTSAPAQALQRVSKAALHTWVVAPLASLYLRGPRVVGCWGGQDPAEICSQLLPPTQVAFWESTPETQRECLRVIERDFDAWMLLLATTLYFAAAWWVLTHVYACACRRLEPSRRRAAEWIV